MTRPLLPADKVAPAARERMARFQKDFVDEVVAAVGRDAVVVVGMKWNPHVPKVRAALQEAGVPFTYLERGSYLTGWKERLAVKLWSGWPTFPQVFVRGTLVGGNTETRAALADGSLRALLG